MSGPMGSLGEVMLCEAKEFPCPYCVFILQLYRLNVL